MAKLIIKLINDVAKVVNHDPSVHDNLKVVYLPNYNVTAAEIIIPAADIPEQISTAGMEASGTGNMKLALNGALTIGTLDGANVEIREHVGADNIFIFGMTADEVNDLRANGGFNPREVIASNPSLKRALDMISTGVFSPDDRDRYHPILQALTDGGDHFLVTADFADYCRAQDAAMELYRNSEEWTRKAILNTANIGVVLVGPHGQRIRRGGLEHPPGQADARRRRFPVKKHPETGARVLYKPRAIR